MMHAACQHDIGKYCNPKRVNTDGRQEMADQCEDRNDYRGQKDPLRWCIQPWYVSPFFALVMCRASRLASSAGPLIMGIAAALLC